MSTLRILVLTESLKAIIVIKIIVKTFQLILPVIIPSWNFFDAIAPSPRVEFTLFNDEDNTWLEWNEFWPRPEHVSIPRMLRRMVWNPCWNESLYVVACAERLIKLQDEDSQKHSAEQIARRIRRHLPIDKQDARFKFRLVFMNRQGFGVKRHVLYITDVFEGEVQ